MKAEISQDGGFSTSDDDSEHSDETFMISFDTGDSSSVSSVSLHGLEDASLSSGSLSSSSSGSFSNSCSSMEEDSNDDEILLHMLNKFAPPVGNGGNHHSRSPARIRADHKYSLNLDDDDGAGNVARKIRETPPVDIKRLSTDAIAEERSPMWTARKRRQGARAPSKHAAVMRSASMDSLLSDTKNTTPQRPPIQRRLSMSEMIQMDMDASGSSSSSSSSEESDSSEESLQPKQQYQQHSRLRKKQQQLSPKRKNKRTLRKADSNFATKQDDGEESECWSEPLPDAELQKHQLSNQDDTTANQSSLSSSGSTVKRWPNLSPNSLSASEKRMGITDHGTIHIDSDSESLDDDDDDVRSMCSGSAASTAGEEASGSSRGKEDTTYEACKSSTHLESITATDQGPTSSSRLTMAAVVSPLSPPPKKVPQLEESIRTTTSSYSNCSQPKSFRSDSTSPSTETVLAKRHQVQSSFLKLDAHMFKVFGESLQENNTGTTELSEATRQSLRATLKSPRSEKKKKKNLLTSDWASQIANIAQSPSRSTNGNMDWSHRTNMDSKNISTSVGQGTPLVQRHSTTSLLETKRSHAKSSRQKLREAFSSLGLNRPKSKSLRSLGLNSPSSSMGSNHQQQKSLRNNMKRMSSCTSKNRCRDGDMASLAFMQL